jgi:peroxiredoxin
MTASGPHPDSEARGPGLAGLLARLPAPLRIGVPILAVAAVVLGVVFVQRNDEPAGDPSAALYGPLDSRPPAKGEPAPDFTLAALDGQPVRLSDLKGTPVVLNFWATWCGPCRAEMPALQESYAEANGSFVILGINSEGTQAETARRLSRDFRDELGLTFPILLDTPDTEVFNQYRLRGLPDTFFIDRDGVVRDVVVGPLSREAMDEKLEALLAR